MRITATIRPYQPSDQSQIEWLLYSRTPPAGQVAWRPLSLPDDLRRISDRFVSFWVATEPIPGGEALVGMTAVADARIAIDVPVPEFIEVSERTARLHHVAIAPERWRRGIGRRLELTAMEWASQNNCRTAILNPTPQQEAAVTLYEATGFTDVGRTWAGLYEIAWFCMEL
jgi:GNAT superfamily N-acetyltransferase